MDRVWGRGQRALIEYQDLGEARPQDGPLLLLLNPGASSPPPSEDSSSLDGLLVPSRLLPPPPLLFLPPCFPSLLAVHLKSQAAAKAAAAKAAAAAAAEASRYSHSHYSPPSACAQLSPGKASQQAGGSSTFHAECIKVPVNCALTSQGELGKAPLGLMRLGGPAGESITDGPRRQQP